MALNFNDYMIPDHALRMSSALGTAVEIGNEFYIPSLHHVESNVTSTEDVSVQSERTHSTISNTEIRAISEKTCMFELQSAREVIQKIDRMYDLYKGHSQLLQEKNKILFDKSIADMEDILSVDALSEKVQQMSLVLAHVKKITMEVEKIKYILRDNVVGDFLNIHVDFHRDVTHFFQLAVEITKDVEDDIDSIKKCPTYTSEALRIEELLNGIWKNVAKLDKSMDIIKEFRYNL
ncbi:uncharacterized protein LOC118197104 [Stegodyphus dumicola]|uniref:uncharacterized protein LOC118197104 n=1 Tax=Stegodyphus dumicola TaxID=202533 RepID=UPI0015AAEF2A|nr:uncharacterized protein LOC118197104 [Stegodyphus dumicola]